MYFLKSRFIETKNHKKTLWTAICQQAGQSRRNEQISRNTLSAKIESRRNRQYEQVNH